jgi:hypothetical protein
MPHYSTRSPTNQPDAFLINAVQYAHLLHEMRRKSTMGTVFHLANYAHWKEMNIERLSLPMELQLKELVSHSMSSMSCKLVLQMLKAAVSSQGTGLAQLYTTADAELESLIIAHQRVAEKQSRILTAFDGIDIFQICIHMVDRQVCNADHTRLYTNPMVRLCLLLCTNISERYSGVKQLLEMLWLFIDLASGDSSNVEADVLRLTQQYHMAGASLPGSSFDHMRAILMRRAGSHSIVN